MYLLPVARPVPLTLESSPALFNVPGPGMQHLLACHAQETSRPTCEEYPGAVCTQREDAQFVDTEGLP